VALAIEQLLVEAGLPEGVFRALVVAEDDVPGTVDRLIQDERIAAVTLTGSNRAGASVAASAGRAAKKTVLELGGSDPFVVLADADLDVVVPKAVAGRFLNGGQSCLCAKRFIVHDSLAEEFGRRFAGAVEELVVGPPEQRTTNIGPLARPDLAETLERQVRESVAAGAVILTGGSRLDRGPAWFAPTVLVDVTPAMPVMAEETFGPAAAVIAFGSDDEAVALANATPYGLGASVWSADVDHALRVGKRIRSGALFVNAVTASDPRLPFGGVKQSGYGRELGEIGAREFTNIRTVVIG
jgi:succinate-semialdehyde dehydrogenase/glutarate-semialdehyde dehydrogenase